MKSNAFWGVEVLRIYIMYEKLGFCEQGDPHIPVNKVNILILFINMCIFLSKVKLD